MHGERLLALAGAAPLTVARSAPPFHSWAAVRPRRGGGLVKPEDTPRPRLRRTEWRPG
jgi:hypothetical protein